jgi:hypothetical protein
VGGSPGRRLPIGRDTLRALGIAVGLTLLPYWEVVSGRRTAMFGDVNDLSVPEYVAVWRSWRAAEWPWWTPAVFGGRSTLGAGQYAVFYPLNAVFGFLEPVAAYRWWLVAHLGLACAGAFAWSWHRFGSRPGAIVAGVAYAGSGFAVLHLVHPPFVIAVAWLPFAFLGVDLVRERWSAGRAAVAAVPIALIGLGGQPQLLWIALVGVGTYAAATVLVDRDLPALARKAAAVGLGIGLAAVQLLPLWLSSRTSQRPDLSTDAAFELSLRPHDLLTLLFPWAYGGSSQGSVFSAPWQGGDLQHEVGMFAGATVLALALVAVVRRRREPIVLALGAVAVVSVLVALGDSTPFGEVLYHLLPLAKSFRAWARTMVLLNLALAMLAGAGVRSLIDDPAPAVPILGAGLGVVALAAIALPHLPSIDEHLVGGSYGLVARGLPVALLVGLLAAVAVMVLHPRAGAAALVAVCAIEVVAFVLPAEWRGQSAPARDLHAFYDEDVPPSFGRPSATPGGVDRWVSDTYGFRSVSLAKDLQGVNGYDSLLQEQWADTAAGFIYDGYPSRGDFWEPGWTADVLRVTTAILAEDKVPTDPAWHLAGAVPGLPMRRWERAPRLPEARLLGAVRVTDLGTIRRALADPTAPLDGVALVEERRGELRGLDEPGPAGEVASADVLGAGRVVVEADRAALLVLSHTWEEGWHATVDGRDAPVLRTDGLVLGIPVPAGHHVVRLHYRPPGLRRGAALSVLSLVALVGAAPVVERARRWQRRRETAPPA